MGVRGSRYITEGSLPRPRWVRRMKARLLAYFWLPCPACGEMFAGFEMGEVLIWVAPTSARMACKRHRYVPDDYVSSDPKEGATGERGATGG